MRVAPLIIGGLVVGGGVILAIRASNAASSTPAAPPPGPDALPPVTAPGVSSVDPIGPAPIQVAGAADLVTAPAKAGKDETGIATVRVLPDGTVEKVYLADLGAGGVVTPVETTMTGPKDATVAPHEAMPLPPVYKPSNEAAAYLAARTGSAGTAGMTAYQVADLLCQGGSMVSL